MFFSYKEVAFRQGGGIINAFDLLLIPQYQTPNVELSRVNCCVFSSIITICGSREVMWKVICEEFISFGAVDHYATIRF